MYLQGYRFAVDVLVASTNSVCISDYLVADLVEVGVFFVRTVEERAPWFNGRGVLVDLNDEGSSCDNT